MGESPPAGNQSPKKKETLKEKYPDAIVEALIDGEGYKTEQICAVKSYKEQEIHRIVTSDGQRHEVSYKGKLVSGGHPAKRKERKDAADKAAKNKK